MIIIRYLMFQFHRLEVQAVKSLRRGTGPLKVGLFIVLAMLLISKGLLLLTHITFKNSLFYRLLHILHYVHTTGFF